MSSSPSSDHNGLSESIDRSSFGGHSEHTIEKNNPIPKLADRQESIVEPHQINGGEILSDCSGSAQRLNEDGTPNSNCYM